MSLASKDWLEKTHLWAKLAYELRQEGRTNAQVIDVLTERGYTKPDGSEYDASQVSNLINKHFPEGRRRALHTRRSAPATEGPVQAAACSQAEHKLLILKEVMKSNLASKDALMELILEA